MTEAKWWNKLGCFIFTLQSPGRNLFLKVKIPVAVVKTMGYGGRCMRQQRTGEANGRLLESRQQWRTPSPPAASSTSAGDGALALEQIGSLALGSLAPAPAEIQRDRDHRRSPVHHLKSIYTSKPKNSLRQGSNTSKGQSAKLIGSQESGASK